MAELGAGRSVIAVAGRCAQYTGEDSEDSEDSEASEASEHTLPGGVVLGTRYLPQHPK